MDGFLYINKEKGMTSFDVISVIKKKLNTKKVGHTGTLDKNASGVLLVGVGNACKTFNILKDEIKEYEALVEFGRSYDTIDPLGELISENTNLDIDMDKINKALEILLKRKTQTPPLYSAIKINGKRASDLATSGKEVSLNERDIEIFDFKITKELYKENDYFYLKIYLKVKKGFYVRSFIRDLGEILNVDINMFELQRLYSEGVSINDTINANDVSEASLIKVSDYFKDLDRYEIKDYLYNMVKNGIMLDERQLKTYKPFIVTYKGVDVAIYEPVEKYRYRIVTIL